jgi:hypothetical protein
VKEYSTWLLFFIANCMLRDSLIFCEKRAIRSIHTEQDDLFCAIIKISKAIILSSMCLLHSLIKKNILETHNRYGRGKNETKNKNNVLSTHIYILFQFREFD